MKMYRIIPAIVLLLFSCSKSAQIEVPDADTQTGLTKPAGATLLDEPEVTDFYLDYNYAIGHGFATVHFTNNTYITALFTVELSKGSSFLGSQTVNLSPDAGIYVSFELPMITSGTLTAKITRGTTSFSTSCSIYDASASSGFPHYRATALSSNPVLNLNYYYNPTNMYKYYTPELVWTSFSNVIPNSRDSIYAAIKYPPIGGSCIFPEYHGNMVINSKINFNSLSNEHYLCMPMYVDYVWDHNQFNQDTVSAGRWTRVNIPWW